MEGCREWRPAIYRCVFRHYTEVSFPNPPLENEGTYWLLATPEEMAMRKGFREAFSLRLHGGVSVQKNNKTGK